MTARILVVAPDLPHPPFTGAHTRPLSLIRALARHYEVVVVGSAAPGAELAPLEDLCLAVGRLRAEPYRRGPARSLLAAARRSLTPVPLIGRSSSRALARLVDDALEKFSPDAIQMETMYAVHYRRAGLPAVIDLPDVVSGLCAAAAAARPLRYAAARAQARAAERVERERLAAFAAILTINEADADRLRGLGLVPTMVPLAIEPPSETEVACGASGGTAAHAGGNGHPAPLRALQALFVASFEHLPNREAARFIAERLVPALRRCGVAARVVVAGRGARGLDLLEIGYPPSVPAGRGVSLEVVSDPADLAPLYRRADVVIVPLAFGGGTKNKTLEAMGWARPVVGTPQAFTGLPGALAGEAFVQTPLDAGAMADALARLAADAALRERLGRAARAYVLAAHTQARVDAAMDDVYERVLGAGARSASGARAAGAPA